MFGSVKYRVPRGFRDFPPEVAILRKKVIEIVEDVFERFGFDPIETPVIEYWGTLKGKYGDEVESKLLYRFQDPWSEEWLALRYDLTVPLARFVASHAPPLPFKRYHIGRVWRHERPQRGRYREFWQCDADIVGSPYPEADAEVIDVMCEVMKALSYKRFRVRLNDRRMLRGVFEEELRISKYGDEKTLEVFRAIDKLDKIGREGVREELLRTGLKGGEVQKIMETVEVSGEPEETLQFVEERFGGNENVKAALSHLSGILDNLTHKGKVTVDLSMVRGLDYYTGPIFETYIEEPKIGALAGGGRYDDLIERYGGPRTPSTGVSIGIERVIDAGLELGMFSLNQKTKTKVFVVNMGLEQRGYARRVAEEIRKSGLTVQVDLMRRSYRKQLEYCDKKGIPYLVFIGDREMRTGTVTLYVKSTGERYEEIPLQQAVEVMLRKSR
ncbi:MAG: histidine--tRNA ligase [Candidatus Freyarchaeota archaeon]